MTASCAYSTWCRRPCGDHTVTSVSYWFLNMMACAKMQKRKADCYTAMHPGSEILSAQPLNAPLTFDRCSLTPDDTDETEEEKVKEKRCVDPNPKKPQTPEPGWEPSSRGNPEKPKNIPKHQTPRRQQPTTTQKPKKSQTRNPKPAQKVRSPPESGSARCVHSTVVYDGERDR